MADVSKSPPASPTKSDRKSKTPSPTKSPGSPTHTIRVLKTNNQDGDATIEVSVNGDDPKVSLEVEKIEARCKGEGEQNGKDDSDEEKEPIDPITDEEVEKILSKFAKMKKADLDEYMAFFWLVDQFRYGAFTVHQLAYRLRTMGYAISNKDIAKMFCDLDTNNDQLVDLEEYLTEMSKPRRKPKSKEDLQLWFNRFDQDRDGFVSRNDVRQTMDSLGSFILSPQLDELMRNDSTGQYNKLSFEDFCFAVSRMK